MQEHWERGPRYFLCPEKTPLWGSTNVINCSHFKHQNLKHLPSFLVTTQYMFIIFLDIYIFSTIIQLVEHLWTFSMSFNIFLPIVTKLCYFQFSFFLFLQYQKDVHFSQKYGIAFISSKTIYRKYNHLNNFKINLIGKEAILLLLKCASFW